MVKFDIYDVCNYVYKFPNTKLLRMLMGLRQLLIMITDFT